jgi:cation:H+ antiporter
VSLSAGNPAAVVLLFLVSAVVLVLAGIRLARHADVIAAASGLGGVWIGAVLLAGATSLPELSTDLAAVRLGAPDLAAGDLFGSSMANMLILAIVSMVPGAELFRRAALDNGLAAALAVTLTGAAATFVMLELEITVLGVGLGPLALAAAYLAGMRVVFRRSETMRRLAETVETTTAEQPARGRRVPRSAMVGFAAASAVILMVAPVFAASAQALAEITGLATSLIGTWLVGLATSLPELVTSLAAVRLKAYDLAVGNLFGSNAINMMMFLPLDLALPGPSIFAVVHPVHALTGVVGIILMALGQAAILLRAQGRGGLLEPGGALMLLVYVAGLWLVFLRTQAG